MSGATLVAVPGLAERPAALVRVKNRADHFEAETFERQSFGVVASGRFRKALGDGRFHRYPAERITYTWPWREVVEVREGSA